MTSHVLARALDPGLGGGAWAGLVMPRGKTYKAFFIFAKVVSACSKNP